MYLTKERSCDVLVVGSGIAGIMAAIEAAEAGCSVILTSSTNIFSGSSFYPGTWGLGLIDPTDKEDRKDLADTIHRVGCGMADPAMVQAFVDGIHSAIEKVKAMGVQLRQAAQGEQKEFIPCFDHKHRDWNGIEFDSARSVFSKRLQELHVTMLPNCEVLELVQVDGAVCGAVVVESGVLRYFGCKSLVLASGGYGGIFKYHLCTEDVAGMGQALALKAGCRLTNMEFMQMMPGYISPAPKTIFNERTFRFSRFSYQDGNPLFAGMENKEALLDLRSTHGPFTTRLPSMAVDVELFRAFRSDPRGVKVSYVDEIRKNPPEFITTYFDWLAEAKHLTANDTINIGIFAHAANGGVKIAPDASTGVLGLFACGEVTGGMHGADRIGGLSTANGLVFGSKAGRSAAAYNAASLSPETWNFEPYFIHGVGGIQSSLQDVMFRYAMVERTDAGLTEALSLITAYVSTMKRIPSQDPVAIAAARRLDGQLTTATCILNAALLRHESRGSHYRSDYPNVDCKLEHRIELWDDGAFRVDIAP